MLDANAEDADWREVLRIVLRIYAEREADRARRAYESHRAREMDDGAAYKQLVQRGLGRRRLG